MKSNPLFIHVLVGITLIFASCQKAPELTVTSPASIDLSVDGSSGIITFTANRDWTISSSDSWVSLSPTSGTASDTPVNVSVRCNANSTYDERTATVTIRMEDLTQSVTVHQPANLGVILPKQLFDLQSDAKTIDVEVQANVQYSVSTSVNWIKQTGTKGLTSKTLTFSIEENKTYDPREGKITIKPQDSSVQEQVISVKQAQKDALNVEKTSYDMPYGGGEIEIKVESNVSFDVTPNADWIHYTQTKALSSSTVCLKIDENATYSSRQGTVEIKQQNGSLKHTVTVNQTGRIAVSAIELDKKQLELNVGESYTLVATVKPDNATDKTISWSSSDESVASVDNGKVEAVKVGVTTITAKAGEIESACSVTVVDKIIEFADMKAKLACVAYFDKNQDGEVSYSEAAAATSLNGVFSEWNTVTSFDELEYFVNVHDLSGVFKNCISLKSIVVPKQIERLGNGAFSGCSSLTTVILPDGLTTIEQSAFRNCSLLSSINIPNTVTSIGQYAFEGCKSLTSIELPAVSIVENNAFYSCSALASISFSNSLTTIGKYAFSRCMGITELILPDSLTSLGDAAFSNCESLKKLTLPSGLKVIPKEAFAGCWELSDYSIPEGVEAIEESALYGKHIWRIDLPKSVVKLGRLAVLTYNLVVPSPEYVNIAEQAKTTILLVPNDLLDGYRSLYGDTYKYIYPISDYKELNDYEIPTSGAVDLNLSVKWAACNLGANSPENAGGFFAWAETSEKEYYRKNNYKYYSGGSYTKYTIDDNLNLLQPEDDAATVILGENWRMPVKTEYDELTTNCPFISSKYNNTDGIIYFSPVTGKAIFLPVTGHKYDGEHYMAESKGDYWTALGNGNYGQAMEFDVGRALLQQNGERFRGLCIRPVQ